MRVPLLAFALVMLAGTIFAAEENLYVNSKYIRNKAISKQRKKLVISKHWIEGTASYDGDYNGAPVLKIEPVKVSWGGFSGMIGTALENRQRFKPGKYTFSVWCKVEGKPSSIYLYHSFQNAEQEKITRRDVVSFKRDNLPPEGEWTKLVLNFEIKHGDTRNVIGYAIHSVEAVGPLPVWFSDPKITPAREE